MVTVAERVAVVGGGPRAAYALERLAALGARFSVPVPTVDVIAPGHDIGPGEIYTAGQPDYFRLNVASSAVHAWNVDSPPSGPSFDEWRHRFRPESLPDQFPPRSLVGHYLAEVGATVRARVPGARIDARVMAVERDGSHVVLDLDREDAASDRRYDEVLLALGHGTDWSGSLRRQWTGALPLASAYPAADLLRQKQEAGGGTDPLVVVRGAALTGLDAALCLTHADPGSARVLIVSRTGRLMAPKTEPAVLAAAGDTDMLVEVGTSALKEDESDVAAALADTATRILAAALGPRAGWSRASSAVRAGVEGMLHPADDHPREWLRHRLAIARGEADPDGAWALGQAWRLLYPALVARQRRLAHLDGPPLGWVDYSSWSPGLERLAFGPPPVNAATLLALMDEARVAIIGSSQPLEQVAVDRGASLVVDAVLAPPGIRQLEDPLVTQLEASGLISLATHGRGARVTHDATCLDAAGRQVPGLAAVGRITEDVVVGNDTLVRVLHPELDRWARRVLGISSVGGADGCTDG